MIKWMNTLKEENKLYCSFLYIQIPFALNILIFKASRGECQPENADTKDVLRIKRMCLGFSKQTSSKMLHKPPLGESHIH